MVWTGVVAVLDWSGGLCAEDWIGLDWIGSDLTRDEGVLLWDRG